MIDRREYQREVAQLLEAVETREQQRYRLEAAGARGVVLIAVEREAAGTRDRLAQLVSSGATR